jgi:hypothetical protein
MRLLMAAALLCALTGCRLMVPGEWERRDKCAAQLRLYRVEPTEEYRVIKVVEAHDEDDLAWKACGDGAEAVIMDGARGSEITVNVEIGRQERDRGVLRGRAIRFVRR